MGTERHFETTIQGQSEGKGRIPDPRDWKNGQDLVMVSGRELKDNEDNSKVAKVELLSAHPGPMNGTEPVAEFSLLGLLGGPDRHPLLFLLFLGLYLLNVLGNGSMALLVWGRGRRADPRLRAPMYFFLSHLSIVDLLFASVTVPQLLAGLLTPGPRAMLPQACFTQMYFFVALGITESYLLAGMAYDRAVAVGRPLLYGAVMTRRRCGLLVGGAWTVAHLHALLHTRLIASLAFPRPARLRHFFCDMTVLLSLATSDTSVCEAVVLSEGLAVVLAPLVCVGLSYWRILLAVLRARHPGGPHRALSTCGAHLTVVALFFGSVLSVYFRPPAHFAPRYDRVAGVVYAVVTPTLNPYIYSLRNREVKGALRRALTRKTGPGGT
ncbi:olfactory receptor 1361-like [Tachyglossus aculeatus]|uniref:olfactory receptor 1361-like n=1 Tax=Tachyglossus aculeatus TaxID=9261 RepID=UPI0018F420E9|nr:olfactory receptor 1361-like [Tachyglossus aculeatus]